MRTEVLREHPYRQGDFPEDFELLLRLAHAGQRLAVVPRILHGWRRGPTTATAIDPRYGLARFTALRAEYVSMALLAGQPGYVLWGYGSTGRALRKALLAHGHRPEYIVDLHPRRLGNRIHGALVIAPEQLGPEHAQLPLLVSVAGARARTEVRAFLHARSLREGEHFVCTA